MRRIPLFLVVVASALAVVSGSALAAVARSTTLPANTALPTITGTEKEGQTLTASNGSWSGTTPISYAYQWQRCGSTGSNCGSLTTATNQNYVASKADVGKTLRVQVTATNADGKSQALSAASAAIVDPASVPANTKQPDPSGTATAGETVKVGNGTWTGLKPITFSYQWQSCGAVSKACTDIAGVTGSSYVIAASSIGSMLRATVTATNSAGKTSAFSNVTTIVLAKALAPVNSSLPVISGSRSVGQRIQASTGIWTGATITGFDYQWSRCNANGLGCAGISGANGSSYGIGRADLGMALRVGVTATNSIGSTLATSTAARITIKALFVARFNAVLRPGQEVRRPHGLRTGVTGRFTARVTGKTLRWTLTYYRLSGRPTATTLSKGLRGTTGLAFKTLCYRCVSPSHGTVVLTASQLDAMLRGRTFVNIRTAKNPKGEIRGQITRVG